MFRLWLVLLATVSGTLAVEPLPRALWIWDAATITDPTKRDAAFALCVRKGITTLFITTGSVFTSAADTPRRVPVTRAQLGQFNRAADALGIAVHGLDGDPSHTLPEQHARVTARFAQALDFNHQQAPAARLRGFQWNIEPHGLPLWKTDAASHPGLLHNLLSLAVSLRDMERSAPTPLPLGFAIPFWYDDPARALAFGGVTRPPAYHFLHLLVPVPGATLALMSYRDTVSGPNSTLSTTAAERAYAADNTPGVRLWIGQETGPFDPPNITFAQEGPAALDAAILDLSAALSFEPVVAGIAIHQITYYRAMLEAQPSLGDRRVLLTIEPDGGYTLRFTRASRDRCIIESTTDLVVGDWDVLATYDPARLRWSPASDAAPVIAISETLAPDGLVSVSVTFAVSAIHKPALFYRVTAE